jgi:hypothetical protein
VSETYHAIAQLFNLDKRNFARRNRAEGGKWIQTKVRLSQAVGFFNDPSFPAFRRIVDGKDHSLFNKVIPSGQKWPRFRKGDVLGLPGELKTIETRDRGWTCFEMPQSKKSVLDEGQRGQATRSNNTTSSGFPSANGPGG